MEKNQNNTKKYIIFLAFAIGVAMTFVALIFYGIDHKKNKQDYNYKNVLILNYENNELQVLTEKGTEKFRIKGFNESVKNTLADLQVANNQVEDIKLKKQSISGKVKKISKKYIDIEGFGKVKLSKDCRYYSYLEDVYQLVGNEDLLNGAENVKFVIENKQICGIFIEKDYDSQNIRVLIRDDGFEELFHNQAEFDCDTAFKIYYYEKDAEGKLNEVSENHSAGEKISILPGDDRLKNGCIKIVPDNENTGIRFYSFSRDGQNPVYQGNIEITEKQGRLVIINELPLEKYLYGVVPSEMPNSYGLEALKVQAVCARSYAVSHLNNTKLEDYGAMVDDSVDYQVYNNTEITDEARAAVDATKGQLLRYNGEIITAYFYSTSCGETTDSTIWDDTPLPYTVATYLGKDSENCPYDLNNNDEFLKFIKSSPDTYDSGNSWYRWNVSLDFSGMTDIVNYNLPKICESSPENLEVRDASGNFSQGRIDNLGNVTKLSVIQRGSGGIVKTLQIEGELGTIRVHSQTAIRNLLNPYGYSVNKADGTVNTTMWSLPSAFFSIEENTNGIVIYGGGYGHGVGMSQSAVKNMIESGMTYVEILEKFYPGTAVE